MVVLFSRESSCREDGGAVKEKKIIKSKKHSKASIISFLPNHSICQATMEE